MQKFLSAVLLGLLFNLCIYGQNQIEGTWNGKLLSPMGEIQITLSITPSPLTGKIATSSGIQGVPVKDLTYEKGILRFTIPSFKVIYTGKLKETNILGTWQQGNQEAILNFSKIKSSVKTSFRSQTPTNMEGYTSEEVQFSQKTNGIILSGTLTIPKGEGPFPAAILLSVAGANDRDQSHSLGHKHFLVLADHLSRQGIAVLRYDDRGVGTSQGDLLSSDFSTFTNDALAAFTYLSKKDKIDTSKIGFIGNSEGTVIGGMCAKKEPKVAFTIMLGAVGVPLLELLADRLAKMQSMYQLTKVQQEELIRHSEALYTILNSESSIDQKRTQIASLKTPNTLDQPGFPHHLFFLPADKKSRTDLYLTPWFKAQKTYNPQQVLPYITCPTLVINGSLDLYQSPELNFPPIQKALLKAGNKDVTLMIAPRVNHVMQDAKTGLPTEYALNKNTFSLLVLHTITNWIRVRFFNTP